MKNITIGALTAICFFAIFYLIGCFIEASFDIKCWALGTRDAIGFMGGLASLVLGALTIHHLDSKL